MSYREIFNIAEICAAHGLTDAVLSPGSRCAPLTLSFARHPAITCRIVPDERSAAFIALGIAQATFRPVALICTSGSATLNFSPAVAEAWFARVPLLLFTADRPPEWIGQQDGQTIHQYPLYGKHIKKNFNLPVNTTHTDEKWHFNRIINEALLEATAPPYGPVHVNVPIREPFYPTTGEQLKYETIKTVKVLNHTRDLAQDTLSEVQEIWRSAKRKMIVPGQGNIDQSLYEAMARLVDQGEAILPADIISNARQVPGALCHHDLFLGQLTSGEKAGLQPDLLITFGDSIISKQLKLFLRECPPKEHVHIQPHGDVADPFQSLTHIVRALPAQLFSALHGSRNEETFQKAWNNPETKSGTLINKFLTKGSFGEFRALGKVMEAIPAGWCTHLANSMAVRYANFLPFGNGLSVWCNRGTSGIDGSNSTAMGHAMANGKENLLITGDMAFLYDRNAFWHRHVPTNLKVIVLNNDGGGIFRMIPGPAALPELETFFETPHGFTAQNTAMEAGFQYFTVQNDDELNRALPRFFNEKNRAIMEIFSDRLENTTIFATLKKEIKEALK